MLVKAFRTAVDTETKVEDDNGWLQSVHQIVDDRNPEVRTELVEQLPHAAMICQEAPHLFGDVLHKHLLGIILKYLRDSENQVQQLAQAALLELMKRGLLDNNTIEVKVFPVVDALSFMSTDFRYSSISLMGKMAPLIGKELTEKLFLDKYLALCEDREFYTRKVCVTHFGELCAAVGKKALVRRLFPTFLDLCRDKIWGVRKACVDAMIPVSCHLSLKHRRILLSKVFVTHLTDESKWVRMSAFQILGPFISTFAKQFTEVSCNQDREVVFTSQKERFSLSIDETSKNPPSSALRYSYGGVYPTTCAVRSQPYGTDIYSSKEACDSSVIIQQKPIPAEENEPQIQKKQSKNKKLKQSDDTDKYNPFLYYYISPDLPLDEDDELVKAAKTSTAESKNDLKSTNNASPIKIIVSSYDEDAEEEDDSLSADEEEEEKTDYKINELIPWHVIDSFLSMAEPDKYTDMGADIPYHCAFSFPAVVLTLGKEYWPYLKKAYESLAGATQWKIRRTLAYSIHEIAIIIGNELTVSDLLPIYDEFIKDLDEVRIGVLKHLATFLKILKPVDRYVYLRRLKDFLDTDNEWNWRFREELATQLLEVVNLYSPSAMGLHIAPLSLELLIDKVAAVRHVALASVTQIVARLSDNELAVPVFLELTKLAFAENWIQRQMYAFVCTQLIAKNAINGDRFCQEMLPGLLKLADDKVPNVRLAVARTLSKHVITMGPEWLGAADAEEVEITLNRMQQDPDRDVRVLAGGEEGLSSVNVPLTNEEQQMNILF